MAVHSRYGDVLELVKRSDDVRVDLVKENERIDELILEVEKPPQFGKATEFVFTIEGHNPVKE